MAGLKLSGIYKSFDVEGKKLPVLRGTSLSVPEGKITVILGQSGCGKTTLLRIAGGLEKPDAGEILWDGDRRPAFVFQEPRLMPWLNVRANIAFGLKRREAKKEVLQAAIDNVGLNGFEKAYPSQLSGGMRGRVALARALAYSPSFILMDEPFAALDYFTRARMQTELLRVQQNSRCGILFVTHSIDEALILADFIAILEKGIIKEPIPVAGKAGERSLLEEPFLSLKRSILNNLNFIL